MALDLVNGHSDLVRLRSFFVKQGRFRAKNNRPISLQKKKRCRHIVKFSI